jgi:membrane protein DedA with SNARE-associated domain
MPEEIVYYITKYGYLAIFILVFLQEIGMPNPFPNELILMFSGYLSFKGLLFLPFVIITALSADFLGTNILYLTFYTTGTIILKRKPKWFPLSDSMIDRLTTKISRGGRLSIYVFRLTPFTRGYASVITGLLQVKPKVFLPIAIISAVTWASVYVVIGKMIGPSWDVFASQIESYRNLLLAVLATVICMTLLVKYIMNRKMKKKSDSDNPLSQTK